MVLLDGVGEGEHAAQDAEADEADGGARDDEERDGGADDDRLLARRAALGGAVRTALVRVGLVGFLRAGRVEVRVVVVEAVEAGLVQGVGRGARLVPGEGGVRGREGGAVFAGGVAHEAGLGGAGGELDFDRREYQFSVYELFGER